MGTSLLLFRLRGIEVRVHWSFLLALAYGAFIYRNSAAGPLVGALYGILVILLLFACVTLHEFGHALTAQYFKVKVSHITLLPIGGVAQLERMPDKPMQEFLITLAGPLVNFAIALLLLPLMLLLMTMQFGSFPTDISVLLNEMQRPGLTNLVTYLVATNILLGVFNLIPAFPMDGGRILRALLAMAMPYVRATQIAVLVGRIMAGLLAVWGLLTGNIIMMLIAFFVYVGGSAERESVESKAVLRYFTAAQALTRGAVNLYSSERLSRAVELIMNSYQSDFPVLDLTSKFVGVLTRPRLIRALQESGPETRIVDVMVPVESVPVVAPTTNLAEVWEQMSSVGSRVVAVKNQQEFLGLITLEDINEVFQVMGASIAKTGKPTPLDNMPTTPPTPEPTGHTAADA
ncbi:MAG: site-2 protease family protein [Caldilineaceae bacterium]|nr:site-2 protease family protein [Caldilineaceae bacterium]